MKKFFLFTILAFTLIVKSNAQNISFNANNLVPYYVNSKLEKYNGKEALVVQQTTTIDNSKSFVLLKGIDFHNGVIEVSVSGQPRKDVQIEGARGFVGVAFRALSDTSKFELFYIRPTNGRADDQVRRNHSTQYVSYPGFPWEKLRKETPEKYEAYADLVPGEWTKLKIEVKDQTAKLYINGVSQPTLIVNDLKQGKDLRGSIGLWLGPGTLAHFSDLKIIKLD